MAIKKFRILKFKSKPVLTAKGISKSIDKRVILRKIDFEIKLKAELSEYIGHEQIVTFNYSNQETLAKFASTIKIDLNKEINLYFDLSQISLFDRNTERRI